MRCKSVIRLLPEYIEGTLSSKRVKSLENHLSHCSGCQHERDTFEKTIHLASHVPVEYPTPELWENFLPELRIRIRHASDPQPLRFFFLRPGYIWKLTSGVCILALLIGAWGVWRFGLFSPSTLESTVTLDAVIRENLMNEIPVRQLRQQLHRELQDVDVLRLTMSDEQMGNHIDRPLSQGSEDQLHHWCEAIVTEVDRHAFDDEELTDLVSSANDRFVFASME